nr:MAG TPA: hypothetical protein [Caudoviricetes sp.]
MLKEKLNSEVVNGMEIPFHSEIKNGYNKAKAQYLHSEKCKRNRASRNQKFNKVRVLYWNLMFLLGGICIVSVGRLIYEIIQILKMQ